VPEQEAGLQEEAYGRITLSIFFMNQLAMTIAFLDQVYAGTDFTQTADLFEYSFEKDRLEGPVKYGQKKYNFPTLGKERSMAYD
jgi:hypothetical protein